MHLHENIYLGPFSIIDLLQKQTPREHDGYVIADENVPNFHTLPMIGRKVTCGPGGE